MCHKNLQQVCCVEREQQQPVAIAEAASVYFVVCCLYDTICISEHSYYYMYLSCKLFHPGLHTYLLVR